MGARQKLNSVHILGSFVLAAIIGLYFESWLAFIAIFGLLIILGVHSGDIRTKKRKSD